MTRTWLTVVLCVGLLGCPKPVAISPPVAVRTVDIEHRDPGAPMGPQVPAPPFPYVEFEITYSNPTDDALLAATITIPEGEGPFPGVVLISGSGPQDRDSTIMGHKPFAVWADQLARSGVAVLRQDDRGVGDSDGSTSQTTIETKAQDALAAIQAFESLAPVYGVAPGRVGLMGHSEGAMVATLATSIDKTLPFVVWLAGPAMDLGQILLLQKALMLETMGADPDYIAGSTALIETLVAQVRDGVSEEALRVTVNDMITLDFQHFQSELSDPEREKVLEGVVTMMASPAIRTGVQYDPASDIAGYEGEFLALWGDKDLQVPVPANSEAALGVLRDKDPDKIALWVYRGLNHLLQFARTGLPSEYALRPETVHPQVLEDVSDWIVAHSSP